MIVQRGQQLYLRLALELGDQPRQPMVGHEDIAVHQADRAAPGQGHPLSICMPGTEVGLVFDQPDAWIAGGHGAQKVHDLRFRTIVDHDQLERVIRVLQQGLQAEPDMRLGIPDLHDDADEVHMIRPTLRSAQ